MGTNDSNGSAPIGSDFSLLEGLFQLAVAGQTDGRIYQRLDSVVYDRLLSQYAQDDAA